MQVVRIVRDEMWAEITQPRKRQMDDPISDLI